MDAGTRVARGASDARPLGQARLRKDQGGVRWGAGGRGGLRGVAGGAYRRKKLKPSGVRPRVMGQDRRPCFFYVVFVSFLFWPFFSLSFLARTPWIGPRPRKGTGGIFGGLLAPTTHSRHDETSMKCCMNMDMDMQHVGDRRLQDTRRKEGKGGKQDITIYLSSQAGECKNSPARSFSVCFLVLA